MKDNKDKIIAFVIKEECNPGEEMTGSYHCDKHDLGGCTKFGIAHTYHPEETLIAKFGHGLKDLTRDEAIVLFDEQYWKAIEGDDLPSGIDLQVMDFAVTSGPRRAEGTYQQMKDTSGYDALVLYANKRREYYNHIVLASPAQGVNLDGWLKRADQALVAAKELLLPHEDFITEGKVSL